MLAKVCYFLLSFVDFALDFADPDGEGEDPAVAYATVYPASIFLRVISAQIIMLLFL